MPMETLLWLREMDYICILYGLSPCESLRIIQHSYLLGLWKLAIHLTRDNKHTLLKVYWTW
ncbi:hypothetical protein CCP4SC76_6470010 [Gammaproteobacteria bacterium]